MARWFTPPASFPRWPRPYSPCCPSGRRSRPMADTTAPTQRRSRIGGLLPSCNRAATVYGAPCLIEERSSECPSPYLASAVIVLHSEPPALLRSHSFDTRSFHYQFIPIQEPSTKDTT